MQLAECPNCNTKYKSSMFTTVEQLPQDQINIINAFNENKVISYCTKCGSDLYGDSRVKMVEEQRVLQTELQTLIKSIPVVSLQNPLNWDFEVIEMVTGQSTTGTGIVSELTSSFTDLFGLQSSRYNNKLKAGEDLCFAQLRKRTIEVGGNAVIATDIDYSEVGGEKGMLMVCMAGTAVKLKNIEILGIDKIDPLNKIPGVYTRLSYLNSLGNTA